MEVEAEKSDCIDTWNYSFLKEYRRELVGGLTLFLEDNEAGFLSCYVRNEPGELKLVIVCTYNSVNPNSINFCPQFRT